MIIDQCSMLVDLDLHYGTFRKWSVYFDLHNGTSPQLVVDRDDSVGMYLRFIIIHICIRSPAMVSLP